MMKMTFESSQPWNLHKCEFGDSGIFGMTVERNEILGLSTI